MSTTLRAAERGWTYATTNDITVLACPTCGLNYGIPESYRLRRFNDGLTWYCPNGHSIVYRETEEDRQRKRAEQAERRARAARESEDFYRERAAAERRRSAAIKGHLTRARNRIAQGVCPVPGCKRSGFDRVAAHIRSQHPDWAHEHPEALS